MSVALSTVRAVLDPDRRLEPDHYVAATRDAVELETHRLLLDLDVFFRQADEAFVLVQNGAGQRAFQQLEAAEAAYGGDFLEEDLYEDWAIAPRERARLVYVDVLKALIELAAARTDHRSVIRFGLRLVESDPYDESAHLAIVAARTAERAHGEALGAYRGYAARMAEIGVTPAPFPRP